MFLRLSKTNWAFLFACFSMFALGISDNTRGPLFPELLRYFNLTNSQASLSFALASACAFFGNFFSAFLLKKIQLDRLLGISMLVMMSGLLAMALGPTFGFYLFGCAIYGFSLGSTGVAQNLLIAENISGPIQTKALSGLHGIYGLSSLIAPLLASRIPSWFSENYGGNSIFTQWQSALVITALMSGLVLLLIASVKPNPAFQSVAHFDEELHGKKSSITTMLWFGGFFATYVGAEILVSTRLALYMRTYFNMSLESSSNYVTYFFMFLLVGRLVFAFKSFSIKIKTQLNTSLVLSLICLALGLWMHPFFLALVGLAMAPFYPLSIVYISEKTGHQKRRFLTFVMGLQSLCVIGMHIGVGYLTDVYGLSSALGVGIALLIGSLVCLNIHPKITV
jgi:FHS family glucose/mannose:H+ symporter-like MFS transporter